MLPEEEKKNVAAAGTKSADHIKFTDYTAAYVSKDSTSEPALGSLNFRLEQGKLLGVIGPVGSGKSTLVNCLLDDVLCLSGTKVIT